MTEEPPTAPPGPGSPHGGGPPALPPDPRNLPPTDALAVATLIVVVAGGVYMTARAGRSLVWPIPLALLGVAAVLFVVNLVLLFTRAHRATYRFDVFWRVGGWAFLAYLVIGGMLEYVFVLDHLRGSRLAVITGLLALFIVDVPLILAFTVARYQAVTGGRAEAAPAPHLAPGPAGA